MGYVGHQGAGGERVEILTQYEEKFRLYCLFDPDFQQAKPVQHVVLCVWCFGAMFGKPTE